MRYYLFLSLPVTLLSGGVIDASNPTQLIFPGRTLQGSRAGIDSTSAGAIPMTPVAPGADDDLCLATATKIQAGSVLHRQKGR